VVNANTAAPALSVAAGATTVFVQESASIDCTGSQPFISATGSSVVSLVMNRAALTGTVAVATASGGGTLVVLEYNTSTVAPSLLTGALLFWDDVPPQLPQGAGTTILQVGGAGTFTGALQGFNGAPLKLAAGTSFSVAAGATLSATQIPTPVFVCTGTVGAGGETVVLPNVVGAHYFFDLTAVTLTGTLTFSAGSGATTAAVTAAEIAATGAKGVIVIVTASNQVCRFG
jgi:hypothetical protein